MTPAKRSRSPRGTPAELPRTAHPSGAAAGEAAPEAIRFEPLPRDWDEQAAALADTFLCTSDPHDSEREVLQRFAHFCLRFAHMEKRIQGEIIFDLSAHPAVVRGEHAPGLLEEAEMDEGQEKALEMLELVGLGDRTHHQPQELSGGQQQRVAIARALVNDPVLVIADEPTGNLDSHSGRDILNLLHLLHQQGVTIVMVTHDPITAEFTQRVIHLADGKIDKIKHNGHQPMMQEVSAK